MISLPDIFILLSHRTFGECPLIFLSGIRKDERSAITIISSKVMRYENISNCFDAFGESRHCTYLSIIYLPTFFVDG